VKNLTVLFVLVLFVTDSFAGGRGSGVRGHTTQRSGGGHHSSYSSDLSTSSFSSDTGNFSLPEIKIDKHESLEVKETQSIVYELGSIKCYVCKTSRTTSFQDMPCGYYAINNI